MTMFLLIVSDVIILINTLHLCRFNTDFCFSNQFSCVTSETKTFFYLFFLSNKQSLLPLKLNVVAFPQCHYLQRDSKLCHWSFACVADKQDVIRK